MTVYFTDHGAKSFYVFRVMKDHNIAGNRLCLGVEGDKDRDRKDWAHGQTIINEDIVLIVHKRDAVAWRKTEPGI